MCLHITKSVKKLPLKKVYYKSWDHETTNYDLNGNAIFVKVMAVTFIW